MPILTDFWRICHLANAKPFADGLKAAAVSKVDALLIPKYRTDYENAINNKGYRITSLLHNELEPQPFGIIRFAIFLKTTFVPVHFTEISYTHDVWTNSHDSVFIGKMKLEDGTYIQNYPVWIVKDYEQQYSLSYHYIDEKNVGMIL